jgi:ribosomal protein S18 acetylase RimI-like enzyme
MSPTIMKARPVDIPDLAMLNGQVQDLHAQLSPDTFRSDWTRSELEALWAHRLKDPASEVFVAKVQGEAVGSIWLEVQELERTALHLARRRVCVHHLVVDAQSRGMGVGAALLDQAERTAAKAGISMVTLNAWAANFAAQGFFQAKGFRVSNIVLNKALTGE